MCLHTQMERNILLQTECESLKVESEINKFVRIKNLHPLPPPSLGIKSGSFIVCICDTIIL